jgi:hypothetical protein
MGAATAGMLLLVIMQRLSCPYEPRKPRPWAAEWRWVFPDKLLRDAAFLEDAAVDMAAFLQGWAPAAAQAAAPARAKWEAVKDHLQLLAMSPTQAVRAAKKDRLRLACATERHARVALLLAPRDASAAAYVAWREAVVGLQGAGSVGARPGEGPGPVDLLWEVYGEQGTKWFHRLGRPRPNAQVGMTAVAVHSQPAEGDIRPHVVSVHDRGGVAAVGAALSAYFDGSQPGGLFAPGQVDPDAQELLLGALDAKVPQEQAQACAGPDGDGLITHACLTAALRSAPSGKSPGSDGITYEALKAFWGVLAEPLVACFNEAFLDDSPAPQLTESQRSGVITLIHKGGGKPVDDVASFRPITLLNCDYKQAAGQGAGDAPHTSSRVRCGPEPNGILTCRGAG